MSDEEMARLFIIDKYGLRKDLEIFRIKQDEDLSRDFYAFLAGLKASRSKWHDLRKNPEDFPKTSCRYLVYTGGEPFFLDFDTETGSFGYWVVSLGDNWGVRDEDFETVKDSGEDEVLAWCEIPKFEEVEELLDGK